jgi:hypothetical protein
MYEIFSRRKLSNVKEFSSFYFASFSSYRKDEIERLRKDFGHMQRSMVVAPPVAKQVTQQDVEFVRIELLKNRFRFYIIFLSAARYKR